MEEIQRDFVGQTGPYPLAAERRFEPSEKNPDDVAERRIVKNDDFIYSQH